jgi:hypothetical protein
VAFLKTRSRLLSAAISFGLLSPAFGAEIPHLIDGYDVSGSTSAAGGSIYTFGTAGTLRFGSSEDPSNKTADTHFNYTSDIAPATPSDPNSPLKHSDNWGGGAKINVWTGTSIGVDLDGLNDSFEGLSTNGQKVTLGYDPFKVSYRFARSLITSQLLLGKTSVTGALIYQNTFELDYDWIMNEQSTISFDGAYSIFNPPAPSIGTLLNAASLASFSNFQDTLQSFEEWRFGADWLMLWTDFIDTSVSAHLSHEIIPANPLIDTVVTVGYQLTPRFHAQVGWEYSHDPSQALNTASLEVRWSWDRKAEVLRGAQTKETDTSLNPAKSQGL